MIQKNKFPFLVPLIGAALLVTNGAVIYWILVHKQPNLKNLPAGANLVPQDALMTLSLSTDPKQWQQLRGFGTPQTQAMVDRALVQLRDRFLTPNGYDYEQDIKSWAGQEVTLAFLSSPDLAAGDNTTQDPSTQQSVVMVLPIEDPLKAKQLLDAPNRPLKEAKWVDRTYKGVLIKEILEKPRQGESAENYSATVLDRRFLVVTTNPKAIDRVIDTYQQGRSLAQTPGYAKAIQKIESENPFAKLYINIPIAAASARNSQRPLSPQGFAQLQQQQGLAATITLQPEGLRFKGISWLNPNSEKTYKVKNNAGALAKHLPANTLMMISGGNLQEFWQEYVQGAESNPLSPIQPEEWREGVQSVTGLNLEQDILSWMNGEFSLSLLPVAEKDAGNNMGIGMVLMVQVSDRRAAQATLQQLDELMNKKYRYEVTPSKIDDRPVVNWSARGVAIASHGWLDGNIAFLTLGAPITNRFLPKPQSPLAANALFQKAVPAQLNPYNGQFFIDLDRTLNVNPNAIPFFTLPPGTTTLTKAMRTIGVTAAVSDERSTRFDIYVNLKKGKKPGSLPSSSSSTSSNIKTTSDRSGE